MAEHDAVSELLVEPLSDADRTGDFEHGRSETVSLADVTVTRATLDPEWGVAESKTPRDESAFCRSTHRIYVVSGTLGLELDDGHRTELTSGDTAAIPPGHRGWTVGDERLVYLEFEPADRSD